MKLRVSGPEDKDDELEAEVYPFPRRDEELPGPTLSFEDIPWFDPESLARRSEIGVASLSRGWWTPRNIDAQGRVRSPCWGALQPLHNPEHALVAPLWNDPEHPLVQDWGRADSLAIESSRAEDAFDFVDQCLESLVVSNLFDREPEPHRAILVTQRSPEAWWSGLLRRWQHTKTPDGYPVDARQPAFAQEWLLISWQTWLRDEAELMAWLDRASHQRALGFHLPRGPIDPCFAQRSASLRARIHDRPEDPLKILMGSALGNLELVGVDPRDRIIIERSELQGPSAKLSWRRNHERCIDVHRDPSSCVFYF